jgi:hypothetical protein
MMLRKRSNGKTNLPEISINKIDTNKNKNTSITILPPSPKIIVDSTGTIQDETSIAAVRPSMVRNSMALFDPDNASPASDFIHLLKLRMSIYYEPEMNILA